MSLQSLGPRIKALRKTYVEGYQGGYIKTPAFLRMEGGLYQVIAYLRANLEAVELVFELSFGDKDLIDKLWNDVPRYMTLPPPRMEEVEEETIRPLITSYFDTKSMKKHSTQILQLGRGIFVIS